MSTIVAKIDAEQTRDTFYIVEKSQNNLKGIIWGSVGLVTAPVSVALTAASVGAVAGGTFAGIFLKDMICVPFTKSCFDPVPLIAIGVVGSVVGALVALKITGYSFQNAIHHFGPQFEIIRRS